jgi:acetyl/propionyl-CoA carboxylase alpha subunit
MEVMGSKTAARRAMVAAGVPVVPGSAAGGPAVLERAAEAIGYPVLVKASGGGGGKGMTIVREAGDFTRAVLRAAAEARRSFGDATVYLEKLIERPRHVEIQVFADDHGHCVSLGERECSIQRRHQKIVEEAPSPVVDAALRERLGRAAVRAAEAVGYRGAGTVELLLSQEGEFWFLEMNTRLQVEHPVTECVTGLDLVRLQLDVAAGSPLPAAALEPTLRGWAIEARVYAEDPAAGHLPQAGPLLAVREPQGPGVRVDSGVAEGGEVSVHYDPLLAKVIGWGADRDEAIDRLRDALARHVILGVRTNLEHLQAILGHPAFREGRLSTAFLDEHLSGWPGAQEVPDAALAATVLPVGRAAAGRGSQRGAQHGASDPWATLTGFRVGPREEP